MKTKKKLSVVFLFSVVAASGFALYMNRSPVEKPSVDLVKETPVSVAPTSQPLLDPQPQTAGVATSPTTVKKAKKSVIRKGPAVN